MPNALRPSKERTKSVEVCLNNGRLQHETYAKETVKVLRHEAWKYASDINSGARNRFQMLRKAHGCNISYVSIVAALLRWNGCNVFRLHV